jgi:uracil phosphoribosyltransferase
MEAYMDNSRIHEIGLNNSVLSHFIAEIRDVEVQKDSMRFRKNMERISEILSYEMSKSLDYHSKTVTTPLGKTSIQQVDNNLVIGSILRAGLTMHQGVLNYFDKAENAFISAYREESDGSEEIKVHVEYLASPSIKDKTLIMVDPMLATGKSMLLTIEAMKEKGLPKKIHVISAIGSEYAMEQLIEKLPDNTEFWIAAIDKELNSKSYIIPGLGDAGDLAYGTKQ